MNNMKAYLIIFFTILCFIEISGQIYLDSRFVRTDKEYAKYYQIIDTLNNRIELKRYLLNDTLIEIGQFKSLIPLIQEGKNLKYYENGQLMYEIDYLDNRINGNVIGYYENGQIRRKDFYKNDTLIIGKCYTKEGTDTSHYLYIKNQ